MRVFLDTNVLASATATRGLCADVLRTAFKFHDVVVSAELLQELRRVLRDKFHAPADAIADLVWLLGQDTFEAHSVPLADMPLKDPADIAIVSAAINGGAEVLITGDKEVLALKRAGSLEIISPRQFWDRERQQKE